MGIRGTRQVVLVRTAPLLQHLTMLNGDSPIQMAALNNWVKTANAEAAKSFVSAKSSQLFCTTVGAGDALYSPAGWVFFEKTTGAQDFAGVRYPVLGLSEVDTLTLINQHLLQISVPSESLQRALDCLVRAE